MKNFQLNLLNFSTKTFKESRFTYNKERAGSRARTESEKPKSPVETDGSFKTAAATVSSLRHRKEKMAKRWKGTASKPGHSLGFGKKISQLISPLWTKMEKLLQKTFTKKDIKEFNERLKSIEVQSTPTRKEKIMKIAVETIEKTMEEIEKIEAEKKGVIARLQELGAKNLGDPVKFDNPRLTFKLYKGHGGMEDQWGQKNKGYTMVADYNGKEIRFEINTRKPHNFTVFEAASEKKYSCNNKSKLIEEITNIQGDIDERKRQESLPADKREKIAKNKAKVEGIIKKLGGNGLNHSINIKGITFRFDYRQSTETSWLKEGEVEAKGTFNGKKIEWLIGMTPPYKVSGLATHEGKIHSESFNQKNPKSDLENFVRIEAGKIALAKMITKLGGKGFGGTLNISGLEFNLDNEEQIESKLREQKDTTIDTFIRYKGEEISWGLKLGVSPMVFVYTETTGERPKKKYFSRNNPKKELSAYVKSERTRIDDKKRPELLASK